MTLRKILKGNNTTEANVKNLVLDKEVINDHKERINYENAIENNKKTSKSAKKSKKSKRKYTSNRPRPPIVYKKYPKLNDLLRYLPLYDKGTHDIGDIVKLKNNIIVQIIQHKNRLVPMMFKLNPRDIEYFIKMNKHQRYINAKWPARNDKNFIKSLQQLFLTYGFSADHGSNVFDPQVCMKLFTSEISLKYYQKISSTFLIYGPYRGLLVWHDLGSGKTCTSIDTIENFIKLKQLSKGASLRNDNISDIKIYVVLPPTKSLEENYRKELSRCPSIIRELIKESKKRTDLKQDMTNRIINKYVEIISYVSLSNRVKSGKINLNNSLLIFDEAHQFLYPVRQFASKYAYLREQLRKATNVKMLLLTATPIFRQLTDLPKLLNTLKHVDDVDQLPENEDDFNKKYFYNGKINKTKFANDVKGYISYSNILNNRSLFAEKIHMPNKMTNVSETHYNKWLETHKNELKTYNVDDIKATDLIKLKDPKFIDPLTGYLKKSSAATNYPVRSFKPKNIWPEKFSELLKNIEKYPNEKHFIYSRHKESGANAIGYYLAQNGWTRMSNNKNDHGTNPPKDNNKVGEEYSKLLIQLNKKEISQEKFETLKIRLLKEQGPKRLYNGFVVLNSQSSQKEIKNARELFNDAQSNVDGKYIRIFIGDDKFAEGVSLFNTRHVHIFEPPYSFQTENQIIGRAIRMCGHKELPGNKRNVRVHKYYAKYEDKNMSDHELQVYNDMNHNILKQIEETAIETSLEYDIENVELDKESQKSLFVFKRLNNAINETKK